MFCLRDPNLYCIDGIKHRYWINSRFFSLFFLQSTSNSFWSASFQISNDSQYYTQYMYVCSENDMDSFLNIFSLFCLNIVSEVSLWLIPCGFKYQIHFNTSFNNTKYILLCKDTMKEQNSFASKLYFNITYGSVHP